MRNSSNLEKYKQDLSSLIRDGDNLYLAIQYESFPKEFEQKAKETLSDEDYKKLIKDIPHFNSKYQTWYSESLVVVKQLLPDRLSDFVRLFEKPKTRKNIDYESYVIEDYLQGLTITRGMYQEKVVGKDAAIPKFEQQLNILKSIEKRFESSLFDIIQLVQADLFDSDLEAAEELNKKGFIRAAGALAGVVLEKHLSQVVEIHKKSVPSKTPTIADYNDLLKKENIIELPVWRHIQYLADIRNKCDHKGINEPTKEELSKLIDGVKEIVKTIF